MDWICAREGHLLSQPTTCGLRVIPAQSRRFKISQRILTTKRTNTRCQTIIIYLQAICKKAGFLSTGVDIFRSDILGYTQIGPVGHRSKRTMLLNSGLTRQFCSLERDFDVFVEYLIDLDVNLALLLAAANHSGIMPLISVADCRRKWLIPWLTSSLDGRGQILESNLILEYLILYLYWRGI